MTARWLLTNGVYVITAALKKQVSGMAAAWVTRVSAQPILIAVSIWHENQTHGFVQESRAFAINILADGQQDIARKFGRCSGRNVDKFKEVSYKAEATGSPVLENALAYLDCRVLAAQVFGDHTLFVGEVVKEGIKWKGSPLIYHHEDYFSPEELRI